MALARYGRPYSVKINNHSFFDGGSISWTIGRGSYPYLSFITATKYKDVDTSYMIGKADQIRKWIIDSVSGFDGY